MAEIENKQNAEVGDIGKDTVAFDNIDKTQTPEKESKKILENNEKKEKVQSKTKFCKVIGNTKNKTYLSFDGFGVVVKGSYIDEVVVTYSGTIGKSDFNIINCRQK